MCLGERAGFTSPISPFLVQSNRRITSHKPTCKDRHAAELIMAKRENLYLKAEYIAADLSIAPNLLPCSPAADHTFSGLIGCCLYLAFGSEFVHP
jgi:hypothetical protein